jgi:hypothetical protein
MRSRVTALICVLYFAPSVLAADRVDKGTVISIDLARKTLTELPSKNETALLDSNTFTFRRNETVRIDILQNPLLFNYEATDVKSDTPSYAAALEFAKQLQALLALFPTSSGSDIRERTVRGIDLEQLKGDIGKIRERMDKIGADIALSLGGAQQVAELKKIYADFDAEAMSQRIDAALSVLGKIAEDCQPEGAMLTTDAGQAISCDGPIALGLNVTFTAKFLELRALERQLAALGAQVERTKEAIIAAKTKVTEAEAATPKKADAVKAAKEELTRLETALNGLEQFYADRASNVRAKDEELRNERQSESKFHPTILEFASRFESIAALLLQHLTTLRAISADVALVQTSKALITIPHSIQTHTITITVTGSPKYDKFLDSDTRRKRDAQLRKFIIKLEPYQVAHLSIAPAFVLGFIRNPEFAAVKDGDAFKITKKEQELTRYTAGVMLNITPDAWQEPTFGGHFQVGISPVKDSLGFFFGAGIKAQTLFSFGGGFMMQQVRKLGDGLALESRLDDPAKLKIDREFKPGLYLHVAVTLPTK